MSSLIISFFGLLKGSHKVQVDIVAQKVGAKEKSLYGSYTYRNIPTSSLSNIIRWVTYSTHFPNLLVLFNNSSNRYLFNNSSLSIPLIVLLKFVCDSKFDIFCNFLFDIYHKKHHFGNILCSNINNFFWASITGTHLLGIISFEHQPF